MVQRDKDRGRCIDNERPRFLAHLSAPRCAKRYDMRHAKAKLLTKVEINCIIFSTKLQELRKLIENRKQVLGHRIPWSQNILRSADVCQFWIHSFESVMFGSTLGLGTKLGSGVNSNKAELNVRKNWKSKSCSHPILTYCFSFT